MKPKQNMTGELDHGKWVEYECKDDDRYMMETFTVKCKNGEMVRDGPWPELEDVRTLKIHSHLENVS